MYSLPCCDWAIHWKRSITINPILQILPGTWVQVKTKRVGNILKINIWKPFPSCNIWCDFQAWRSGQKFNGFVPTSAARSQCQQSIEFMTLQIYEMTSTRWMNHLAILTNARQQAITVTATSTNPDIFAGSRATMELNTIAAYGSSVASPENPNMCKQETGKDSSNQFLKFSLSPWILTWFTPGQSTTPFSESR